MATEPNAKAKAWVIFDRIVARAAPDGVHTNPWHRTAQNQFHYEPDYVTLEQLLGVPLHLGAGTRTGVPALALDVWLSYELRRAGFNADQAWPRPVHPRILPASIANLLKALPGDLRRDLEERITKEGGITGATSASGLILGKNYLKQVDVIISDWDSGPELLISTKRMDASYAKNAPNRIEESYGDAKNLRLRHPLAALGFLFGLRSDILREAPDTAEWLFDLLGKLGHEEDAYHATCVILMKYSSEATIPDTGEEPIVTAAPEPGIESEGEDAPAPTPDAEVDRVIANLPKVTVLKDEAPPELSAGRFLALMIDRVLRTTPVDRHRDARSRRAAALQVA